MCTDIPLIMHKKVIDTLPPIPCLQVRNYYVARGLNSFGIAAGAGFGKALAEWVAAGEPPYDLWAVDVRRFGPHHNNKQYLFERTREAMGRHYLLPYPKWELVTGR